MKRKGKWLDLFLLRIIRVGLVFLICLKSLFTRQRMSHQNGIVVTGKITIRDDIRLPANDFFEPGREFNCRLRHATVRFLDDAGLIPRSASLKFADSDNDSPLDLLMNTGSASPFYSMNTFWQFMKTSIAGGRVKSIEYLKNNPRCFVNFRRAVRRNPKTFAQLYYHTQTIFEFHALDGKERFIRFRLIPWDKGPETGLPKHDDLETVWFQEAKPGETRSRNYLKDEYRERLKKGPVKYHLQAQVRELQPNDRYEVVVNSVYEWPEDAFPWLDIATVRITDVLRHDDRRKAPAYSVERGDHTLFTLGHRPDCIKLLTPMSINDPASLDYLRVAGVWARRVRLFAIGLFGPLKPIPDEREAQSLDDEATSTVRADDVYIEASLPQHDDGEQSRERAQQLEATRGDYQFWGDSSAPPYVKKLPEEEEFTSDRLHRMNWDLVESITDLGLAAIERRFNPEDGLEAYDDMYPLLGRPDVSERFKTDEEFGRQRLAGVNPFMIQRCRELPDPDRFPVTDETVAGLLPEGSSLAAELEAGRLYLLDYALLDGIEPREGCFLTAPLCLLFVDPEGRLMPLAIQLGQSPEAGPVFTPKDEFWLWQTVKTFVNSADGQYQEAVSHLLRTHLVLETFAVGTHRQLARAHPVFKLLKPHFRFTMAINHSARHGLLAHGGPIDTVFSMGVDGGMALIAKAWNEESWTFQDYVLEHDLEKRGVGDPDRLPNYHYRDDGRLMWATTERFVRDVLGVFYRSDTDVQEDFELQAWQKELSSEDGGRIRGLPVLDSLDALVEVVTTLIFTASSGHSATNNGQYDMYGYIPNVPGCLTKPPPREKEDWSEEELASALPKGKAAAEQIATAHLLSEPTLDPLGSYRPEFFAASQEVETLVQRFQRELNDVSNRIEARNDTLAVPYTYLDPRRLYPSVEI